MRKEFRKRQNGKQSSMTAERIAELNSLGFERVVVDNEGWEIRLQELQDFRQANGHCRVPRGYPQNPSLGIWVSHMRKEFRKHKEGKQSRLMAERIAALDNLGFDSAVGRSRCQSSTESTSSKHHELNNSKHDPNKASMCHDRSHRQQCHQQH